VSIDRSEGMDGLTKGAARPFAASSPGPTLTVDSHSTEVQSTMSEPLAISLFSGTDDRLGAAAVLVAGAAALGRPVHLFLQYWALDAFRADRIDSDHGLAPEAGRQGTEAVRRLRRRGQASWAETLRQAKEIGDVEIRACSLSMDLLELAPTDLDPLVDGIEGVASFWSCAETGQVLFI
jgi:peroxiredoxin family protein